jgi:chromosome segregation ATPase
MDTENILKEMIEKNENDLLQIHQHVSDTYLSLDTKIHLAKQIYNELLEEKKEEITLEEALKQEVKILKQEVEILDDEIIPETSHEIKEEILLIREIHEISNYLKGIYEELNFCLSSIKKYKEGKIDKDFLDDIKPKLALLFEIPQIENQIHAIKNKIEKLKKSHQNAEQKLETIKSNEKENLKNINKDYSLTTQLFEKMQNELENLERNIDTLKNHFNFKNNKQ